LQERIALLKGEEVHAPVPAVEDHEAAGVV